MTRPAHQRLTNLIDAHIRMGTKPADIATAVLSLLGQEPPRTVEAERIAAMENK